MMRAKNWSKHCNTSGTSPFSSLTILVSDGGTIRGDWYYPMLSCTGSTRNCWQGVLWNWANGRQL